LGSGGGLAQRWRSSLDQRKYAESGNPVSTEMGDRVRVQLPVPDISVGLCNQPPRPT